MRFVPHAPDDVREMLAVAGAESIDELFSEIPAEVRFAGRLDLPDGLSEAEVLADLGALAARNRPASSLVSFLGAGVYDHYVPAVVDAIVGRSEFLTAYTPYQPERSQGLLQAIFEYQTTICELTQLDVSNACMYDGATATVEAVLLAAAQTRRMQGSVIVSRGVHPEYRRVLATQLHAHGPALVEAGHDGGGRTDLAALRAAVTAAAETSPDAAPPAAVVLQQPSFFGGIEDMREAARVAHDAGALLVAVVDPLSLGLLAPPGQYGADIAVGEGQPLGNTMNFGGPGFGFMAATRALMRRMPGRIVGETTDLDGKRGFVLTLQTREQHIRRESATSNICSNQALCALAGLVHATWLGKEGVRELALHMARKTAYLRERLLELPGVEPFTQGPLLREFAVRLPRSAAEVAADLLPRGFLAGVDLGRFDDTLADVLLVAVSERRTKAELDAFVVAMDEVTGRG